MGSKILFDGAYVRLMTAAARDDYVLCVQRGVNRYEVEGHLYARNGVAVMAGGGAPQIDVILARSQAQRLGLVGIEEVYGPASSARDFRWRQAIGRV